MNLNGLNGTRIFWLFAIVAVQGCWLYVFRHPFTFKWNAPKLPYWELYGFYLISFIVSKWFHHRKAHNIYRYCIGWLLWLLIAMVFTKYVCYAGVDWSNTIWCTSLLKGLAQMTPVMTPVKFVVLYSAVFWFLGQRLACVHTDFKVSLAEFQFGFAILLILFFIYTKLNIDVTALTPVPIIFFFSALISLSIAYALTDRGWLTGQFRLQWIGVLGSSLLLILLMAAFFMLAADPDIIRGILSALKQAAALIWNIILAIMKFMAGLFSDPEPYEMPGMERPAFHGKRGPYTLFRIPENVRQIGGYVYMVFWLILILLALRTISAQVFSWLRRTLSGTQEAEVKTLQGAFRRDLKTLIKAITAWLTRLYKLLIERIQQAFYRNVPGRNLGNIRQIYRQLLKSANKSGVARGEFQTPFEYQINLTQWLPEAKQQIEFITNQYVIFRYSRHIPCEQTMEQIKQCWLIIKKQHLKKKYSLGGKSAWYSRKRNRTQNSIV